MMLEVAEKIKKDMLSKIRQSKKVKYHWRRF